MLGVEPLELQFGCNKQKQILSCLVELSNDTDGFIVFEIQKLRPLPYSIKPKKDIVKPQSKYSVEITLPLANMQALQYSTSSKGYNEFIVRSIKVNDGLTTNDINEEIFDKHTAGQHIDEIHLTVVCEELCRKEVLPQPLFLGLKFSLLYRFLRYDLAPEGISIDHFQICTRLH